MNGFVILLSIAFMFCVMAVQVRVLRAFGLENGAAWKALFSLVGVGIAGQIVFYAIIFAVYVAVRH